MLGILIVCYLFLGGAGAAALFLLIVFDLIATPTASQKQNSMSLGYPVSLVTLCLSALCLVADIGRLDRVIYLFTQPSPTYMTVGAYALVLLIICAGFLTITANLTLPRLKPWSLQATRICGLLLAAVVMVYTGLFFQSIDTVAFWASPVIPVIFVVSSFSTGSALLLGLWYFTGNGQKPPPMLWRIACFDLALVFLEVVCVVVFAYIAISNSEIIAAIATLTIGEYAAIFWVGFVICGLALPVIAQTIFARRNVKNNTTLVGLMSLVVLVGGFSLRWCVVLAGVQPLAQPLATAWGL